MIVRRYSNRQNAKRGRYELPCVSAQLHTPAHKHADFLTNLQGFLEQSRAIRYAVDLPGDVHRVSIYLLDHSICVCQHNSLPLAEDLGGFAPMSRKFRSLKIVRWVT